MHFPTKDEHAEEGPDQARSWLIAMAGFVINSLLSGITRTSGLFYVSLIETYGITRMEANLPFTLRNVLRYLASPVAGAIGHRYGTRNVTFVGGLFGALGIGLCCFAPNVAWISVFWGGIYGIGVALGNTVYPVTINQYFLKHRTTASGVSASGSCIGSFIFPVVVEYLLRQYGLSGTFLIIGGVILHVLPAALLLTEPPWEHREKITKRTFVKKRRGEVTFSTLTNIQTEDDIRVAFLGKESIPRNLTDEKLNEFANGTQSRETTYKIEDEKSTFVSFRIDETKRDIEQTKDRFRKINIESASPRKSSIPSPKSTSDEVQARSLAKSFSSLLRDPMFYVISISFAGMSLLQDSAITVIVDYMKEKRLQENSAKYFITFMSVGDLFGKLGFGWVTDRNFMTVPKYMLLILLAQGISFMLLQLFYTFWILTLIVVAYGVALGATVAMYPILVAKYLASMQTLAIGSIGIISCILSLAIPPLIGYFKDRAGSYDGLFVITGSLSILAGCLWIFEPLYLKFQKNYCNNYINS